MTQFMSGHGEGNPKRKRGTEPRRIPRLRFGLPVQLALLSLLMVSPSASAAKPQLGGASRSPNALFILVDDMGWRDLACYGHKIHETPNIDGLAARGMRFTNAYAACPICAPSRAAIMTGKFPSNTGFVDNFTSELDGKTLQRAKARQFLKLEEVTLAEAFKAGGYQDRATFIL